MKVKGRAREGVAGVRMGVEGKAREERVRARLRGYSSDQASAYPHPTYHGIPSPYLL